MKAKATQAQVTKIIACFIKPVPVYPDVNILTTDSDRSITDVGYSFADGYVQFMAQKPGRPRVVARVPMSNVSAVKEVAAVETKAPVPHDTKGMPKSPDGKFLDNHA